MIDRKSKTPERVLTPRGRRTQRHVDRPGIVPLAELFGFTDAIRSVSQGRASPTMTPAGYRPAPS